MNHLFSERGGSCPSRGSSPAVRTFQRLWLPAPSDTRSLPRPQLNIQSHPSPAGALRISLANRPGGSAGLWLGPAPARPRPRAAPAGGAVGAVGAGRGRRPRERLRAQRPARPCRLPAGSRSIPCALSSRSISDIPPHPQAPTEPLGPNHLAVALGLHGFPGILLITQHPCSSRHPGDPTACHGIPALPEHPWDPRASYSGSYLQVSSHSCDCCTIASCQL